MFKVMMVMLLAVFLNSCDIGGGETVNVKTSLVSTTLATNSREPDRSHLSTGTSTCGAAYAACVTPINVSGKAYYAGMIVGGGGTSEPGLSLGPMIGTVRDPSQAVSFSESGLSDLDLSQQLVATGSPSLGGPIPYPSDTAATVQNFHVYFGYVDIKFKFDSEDPDVITSLEDTHIVRLYMADIDGTSYKKGDLLYKNAAGSDFKWCVSGSLCAETTRPSSPIQYTAVANFSSTNEGNKTIPSFFMKMPSNASPVQVKKSDLTNAANTNTFKVDFAMAKAIKFATAPSVWSRIDQVVSALRLPADPGSDSSAFTVTITYTP